MTQVKPYLKEGTFEPGMSPFPTEHPLADKVVSKWHTTDTGPREYIGFGYYRRPVVIEFEGGLSIDAWEDSK
jgi:hypothetical protein